MLDRYNQHTKNCIICKAALTRLRHLITAAQVAAGLAFLSLAALLGTTGVTRLISGAAGSGAAVGAVALVAVMGLCAVMVRKWQALTREFVFTDFVHAERH